MLDMATLAKAEMLSSCEADRSDETVREIAACAAMLNSHRPLFNLATAECA